MVSLKSLVSTTLFTTAIAGGIPTAPNDLALRSSGACLPVDITGVVTNIFHLVIDVADGALDLKPDLDILSKNVIEPLFKVLVSLDVGCILEPVLSTLGELVGQVIGAVEKILATVGTLLGDIVNDVLQLLTKLL